ncbi:MAG: triphosphoribosyl-dephospho-CoA synthase [Candidatus Helarchaeota archaeon]|nr:triphosphoribosyl-dephospho-CoA synthase [Candidatus Helarchaeota archaeon]
MNEQLIIKNGEDIVRCSQIAMVLEVSGYPKPGNVHRTQNFPKTQFEHFLIGAIVCRKSFYELVSRSNKIGRGQLQLKELNLGKFILQGVKETLNWQRGGNINLGLLLLLGPLSAAAGIILEQGEIENDSLREVLSKILKNTTSEDTINLYEAIEICQPGGLGQVKEFDVMDKSSKTKILKKNINLYDIFKLSASWDNIAAEYVSDFKITFEIGVPYFKKVFEESKEINIATVDTFLYILSCVPDSLIQRKTSLEKAKSISERAKKIVDGGGLRYRRQEIIEFDNYLQKKSGKMNPGTTADLTAASIMVNLLYGLKI